MLTLHKQLCIMKQQQKTKSLIAEKYRTPIITKEEIDRGKRERWLRLMKAIDEMHDSMVELPMPQTPFEIKGKRQRLQH